MNNMKKYACDCIKQADDSAERLRNMANVIGTEARYEDGVCTAANVQRFMKINIKEAATDMQNLVREMADQLDAERAEVERMKRLYAMARKEASHFEDMVERAKAIRDLKGTSYQASNGEENVDASAEFLRDMVAWVNARPDILNDGKTIDQLIMEHKESQAQ